MPKITDCFDRTLRGAALRRVVYVLMMSLLVSSMAAAQGLPDEEEKKPKPPEPEPEPTELTVAVLDVRDGGTEMLRETLGSIDIVNVRDQAWFLARLEERAIKKAKIMTRPEDLRWVMRGADISLIVYVALVEEGAKYEVRFVGHEGKVVDTVNVTRDAEEGMSQDAVDEVAEAFEPVARKELERQKEAWREEMNETRPPPAASSEETGGGSEDSEDPYGVSNLKKQTQAAPPEAKWMEVRADGRIFRREFTVSSAADTVLSYRSQFFPGYAIAFEGYPFYQSKGAAEAAGFYGRFQNGFDSLELVRGDESTPLSAVYLAGEAGFAYRFHGLTEDPVHPTAMNFALRVGGAYASYAIDDNDRLPSTSEVSAVVGVTVAQRLVGELLSLELRADFIPYSAFLEGKDMFGEGAYSYGGRAALAANVHVFGDFYANAGYGFEMLRTVFSGRGQENFVEADAFEFRQSISLGAAYWF